MATKNVTIAGANYTAVPAVDLPVTGGGTARFTEVSDTTAAASDVAQGKYFYNASGQKTLGTASGGSSTDFVVSLSPNENTQMWEPDKTFAEISQAYSDGKTIALTTGEAAATVGCEYDSGLNRLVYMVCMEDGGGVIVQIYLYDANGLSLDDEFRSIYPVFETVTKTYTPSASTQTETVTYDSSNYNGLQQVNVTVNAMPSGSVTAPSTISGTSASVSTGTNTLTLSKTVSVTPSVTTSGYVSSGTAGNSAVSLTANVTTKGAATITPTTTNQTISSGTYLTGTQTIAGDADLVAGNIKKDVQIFGVTGTYEASGGGATVQTKETETLSSTVTSISFTGLSAQPKMWAVQNEVSNGSYFSGASTRYITSCLCSGGSTVYSLALYKSGSTAREYGYTTCTWSYSNGTLTVTSPGTSTAGGFRTGSKYRLFCAY